MIHIITVYDSLNYGSYLQADALYTYLSKFEEVDFVDINHQSNFKQTLEICLKKFLKGKISDARLDWIKYSKFVNAQKAFKTVPLKTIYKNAKDTFIFGSDEIWNVDREKIRKSKEFFGQGIESERKIAIAPSVNTVSKEGLSKYPYVKAELEKFLAISVRDQHTKDVVEEIIEKKCSLVTDPTLLFDKSYYKQKQVEICEKNYILLYTYGRMLNEELISDITAYAKLNNKKIISVGKWFDFCDENVPASPEMFLGYMDAADYVFTDTFHGLMFSLIYEKQVLVFPCGNTKVEQALEMFKISQRMYTYESTIDVQLSKRIDYENVVTPFIQSQRMVTHRFIQEAIELGKRLSDNDKGKI